MTATISGLPESIGLEWDNPGYVLSLYKKFGEPVDTRSYKSRGKVQELWQRAVGPEKDAKAMVVLGSLYTHGYEGIVERDFRQAYRLFNDAADLNDSDAFTYLLWMTICAKPNACGKEAVTAVIERIRKAATEDLYVFSLLKLNFEATNRPVPYRETPFDKCEDLFKNLTWMGCPEASVFSSLSYVSAKKEEIKNESELEQLFLKAIQKGHLIGYFSLACWWNQKEDFAKCKEYLQKGAEAGDLQSMATLARLYAGHGGRKTYCEPHFPTYVEKAKELYKKCAEEGEATSMKKLGEIFAESQDGRNALFWYKRAFEEKKTSKLARTIADLYGSGLGDLPVSQKQKALWLSKAGELDDYENHDARLTLAEIRKIGPAEIRDQREAAKWTHLAHLGRK